MCFTKRFSNNFQITIFLCKHWISSVVWGVTMSQKFEPTLHEDACILIWQKLFQRRFLKIVVEIHWRIHVAFYKYLFYIKLKNPIVVPFLSLGSKWEKMCSSPHKDAHIRIWEIIPWLFYKEISKEFFYNHIFIFDFESQWWSYPCPKVHDLKRLVSS